MSSVKKIENENIILLESNTKFMPQLFEFSANTFMHAYDAQTQIKATKLCNVIFFKQILSSRESKHT